MKRISKKMIFYLLLVLFSVSLIILSTTTITNAFQGAPGSPPTLEPKMPDTPVAHAILHCLLPPVENCRDEAGWARCCRSYVRNRCNTWLIDPDKCGEEWGKLCSQVYCR